MKKITLILAIIILFSSCTLFQKTTDTTPLEKYKFNGIYHTIEDGFEYALYADSTEVYYIDTVAIVRFSDFDEVEKRKNKTIGGSDLFIKLNEEAKENFAKATKEHIGEVFTIILQDKMISAPIVMEEITGGEILLTAADEKTIDEIVKYYKATKK
jgi:preprotein translocase subunit SecD